MKKVQFIIISTILSFGLIISSALLSNAIDKSSKADNEIVVKGVAERKIKADRGVVSVVYLTRGSTFEDVEKIMTEKREALLKAIEELELTQNNYNIENLKIRPEYVGETNRISRYELSQMINISLKDLDKIDMVYTKLSELKLIYNNFDVIEPEYFITNIERYKNDLLVEATKNAQSRAFEILKASGKQTGELKNAIQGQFEILEDNESTENIRETIINQKNKKLRVVVTNIYAITSIK